MKFAITILRNFSPWAHRGTATDTDRGWLVAQTGPDASGFRRMVFGRWADCQSATSRRVGTSLRYGGSAKMRPPTDRLRLTSRRGLRFHRPFRDTMSIAGFNASLKLGGALWFAVSTLLLLPTLAARSTVVVGIGQNFTGSTFGFQANESAYVPADCNGAVGPNHFVEL